MVDQHFVDPRLAELYDVLHPWEARDDLPFYLPLVMSAETVLDVGCGTGALLRRARESGHAGHLCGLDPADAMLEQARTRSDIEWLLGDLTLLDRDHQFDLVVMTGHAFQVFVDDDQLMAALKAIRAVLTEHGCFAFETRNPKARAWDRWTPEYAVQATDASGAAVRMTHEVETPVEGDVVRFTTTYTSPRWDHPYLSRSTLRFVDESTLRGLLTRARLAIEEQFGDWNRCPLTDASSEIITIARRD